MQVRAENGSGRHARFRFSCREKMAEDAFFCARRVWVPTKAWCPPVGPFIIIFSGFLRGRRSERQAALPPEQFHFQLTKTLMR